MRGPDQVLYFPFLLLLYLYLYLFENTELALGKVLGRGGFCVVYEVNKISLKNGGSSSSQQQQNKTTSEEDEYYIHNIVQDRGFMASHCIRKGKDYRYAVKKMQDASRKDPQTFINSIVDLAVEARFLSVVRHPNIIKMRAMDRGDRYSAEFFVVLDKLYDIMPVRLQKWKKQKKGGLAKMMFDRKGKKEQAFWVERLTVSYDIACALNYLHCLR
jgi:serine/threonine protein kinase